MTVTATFKSRSAAQTYLDQLDTLAISPDQISVLASDSTRSNMFSIEEDNKAPEGASSGATLGGLFGAVVGALATAGTLVIPGLNLIVSGALVGTLAGLGTGAAAGGLLGGLIGAGIPEHEAKIYENEIKGGAVLIAVEPRDSAQKQQILDVLDDNDAYNVAA